MLVDAVVDESRLKFIPAVTVPLFFISERYGKERGGEGEGKRKRRERYQLYWL